MFLRCVFSSSYRCFYHLFFIVLVFFVLIFLQSCGGGSHAPVIEGSGTYSKGGYSKRTQKPSSKRYKKIVSNTYKIKKGDTLFSIAWKYGLDFRDLARINKIKNPYKIYAGSSIKLKTSKKLRPVNKGWVKPKPKSKVRKSKTRQQKRVNQTKKQTKTSQQKRVNQTKKQTKTSTKKTITRKPISKAKINNTRWTWPVRGKIIQRFNLKADKKGIDLALAKQGLKIKAAESGKVVYSGHGLTGYGLLVIIKHNDRFLSAYAHNSKLLVTEGMTVKRNHVIALSGKTASDRIKLHFEIRLDGKPVNPLLYLPK